MLCPVYYNSKNYPNNTAIISEYRSITYLDLEKKISGFQSFLLKAGVSQEDKIALIGNNSIEYIALFFAIWRLGAIAFPLNRNFPVNYIEEKITGNNVSLILTDSEKTNSFNDKIPVIDFETISTKTKNIKYENSNKNIAEKSNALFILTSGSSGTGKTVVLSFENIYYNALSVLDVIRLNSNGGWLLSLPLFHVGGIAVIIRSFLKGASVIIRNKRLSLLENILKWNISHLSLVSTQLIDLTENIKNSNNISLNIKAILLGGSAFTEKILGNAFKLNLPIYSSYGLSEMAATVSINKFDENIKKHNSSGKILKYGKVKIGGKGEILLKGIKLFKGYYKTGQLIKPFNSEGWFESGDIGFLNKDNELFILNRADNMFVSGGENIFPEEIEKLILQMEGVMDVRVIPIADKKFGFRPIAFIRTANGKPTEITKIRKYLLNNLPKFKVPDGFYKWPNQKTDKIKLITDDFVSSITSILPRR